jgi:plasmid stabilization system protein ParE
MSLRLTIRKRARDDIATARDWYDEQTAGLGARFGDELATVMDSLVSHPLIYAIVYSDVRRAMTRRFPYGVYFTIEGDRVVVLRVLHQARDPRHWPRR